VSSLARYSISLMNNTGEPNPGLATTKEGKPMRLKDKVAIVTGGATGIGQAITAAYAREGAKVVIASRRAQVGEAASQELTQQGYSVTHVQTDISRLEQLDNLVAKTLGQFGQIDILVNNAGIVTEFGPFFECTEERFDKVTAVNLKGSFFLTQKVAAEMIEAGRGGKIIFISSNVAQMAQADSAHYVATKGGLNSLVINLAGELGPHGINVNAISPGEIFVESAREWFKDPANQRRFEAVPLRRVGQPQDVAGAAVFLAGSESDYVTGANIPVDGGQLIT